jgi:septum formation protein
MIQMGLKFEIVRNPISENMGVGESPIDYVTRMSAEKSFAGYRKGGLVIGADTIVLLQGEVIGKPGGVIDARDTLLKLSGKQHLVLTSVSLFDGSDIVSSLVRSEVTMRALSRRDIYSYLETKEPLDKAGAYGIQGLGAIFIEHISGSYSGIMGLPIRETEELLRFFSIDIWDLRGIDPDIVESDFDSLSSLIE